MTSGNILLNTRFLLKWFYILLLSFASHAMESSDSIKIVNWNVLYGFNHGKAVKEGSAWISKQQSDVVALQELNGISEEQLAEYSSAWNHSHAVTHKDTGFPVGLTSKEPIQVIERIQKGGHHGYLHCKTYDIHFFVVHFWPGVIFEIDRVTRKAKALIERNQRVIILGDFNGCSRKDEVYLETHATLREVDYAFADQVENAGFIDLVYKHDPKAKISCPSPITIPKWTPNLDELKKKQYRIDFIFADPLLAKQSLSATISLDNELDSISDHYPVIVEINLLPKFEL